jgi:hypothetical protein
LTPHRTLVNTHKINKCAKFGSILLGSSSKFSTISFIFVNEINIIINCTSWILNIWSLVQKRIQIKLVRVASSAHSFNLMCFAGLVIIFSISTPCNYPIVAWSCDYRIWWYSPRCMVRRSINECQSNDCRSYECRRNNCRSYDSRSNNSE